MAVIETPRFFFAGTAVGKLFVVKTVTEENGPACPSSGINLLLYTSVVLVRTVCIVFHVRCGSVFPRPSVWF